MADKSSFRRWYGASPWHLMILVAQFLVVVYAVTRIVGVPRWVEIGLWFAGAVVLWDFLLFPLLLVGDWVVRRLADRLPEGPPSPLNHVRIPLLSVVLLLLVFWPLVLRDAPEAYRAATGLEVDPFLWRWAAVSAALVLGAALVYAFRLARRRES